MGMVLYSLLLGTVLAVSAPVWGWRMLRQHRYRAGLRQRLGALPAWMSAQEKRVVWVHAVSVGEVLAAERMIRELAEALGPAWGVVVSTTTETGHAVARERFGAERVFYWPLDFGFTVRRFLRALRPEMLVLVESELWPRMLHECGRAGVPVIVVNARMSDRSFQRAMRVRTLWRWIAREVTVFFAQGDETASRLRMLGASEVQVLGNLKFDLIARPLHMVLAGDLAYAVRDRVLLVAGSTLEGEEEMLLAAWPAILHAVPDAVLLLAPRHPQRFSEVELLLRRADFPLIVASQEELLRAEFQPGHILLLDTLGDLADMYGIAKVAFVGGSLVPKGGHNPLEAARFGVPVVMGTSYENFREIVDGMLRDEAIAVVPPDKLAGEITRLLQDDGGLGERGRIFFMAQAGATARTVAALRSLLHA